MFYCSSRLGGACFNYLRKGQKKKIYIINIASFNLFRSQPVIEMKPCGVFKGKCLFYLKHDKEPRLDFERDHKKKGSEVKVENNKYTLLLLYVYILCKFIRFCVSLFSCRLTC